MGNEMRDKRKKSRKEVMLDLGPMGQREESQNSFLHEI